jgi:hypothetical protein
MSNNLEHPLTPDQVFDRISELSGITLAGCAPGESEEFVVLYGDIFSVLDLVIHFRRGLDVTNGRLACRSGSTLQDSERCSDVVATVESYFRQLVDESHDFTAIWHVPGETRVKFATTRENNKDHIKSIVNYVASEIFDMIYVTEEIPGMT